MQTSIGAAFRPALALLLALGLIASGPALAAESWPAIREDVREGRYDAALARLRRLTAAAPEDREAHYYMAIILWRQGDMAAAAGAYRRVLALDPQGPFGADARLWLASYAPAASPTPVPTPTPTPPVSLLPLEASSPLPSPGARASGGKRLRSARPLPGHFKVADGTFEFVPPAGFRLLNEGSRDDEVYALFGAAAGGPMPPTLLLSWREAPELAGLAPVARRQRERHLLATEAASYGPGARLEHRYGGPCYRVAQQKSGWAAESLLFFQNGRLYVFTYGGASAQLTAHQREVARSLSTPRFYP